MTRSDNTRDGVAEAFAFWLSQHDVTVPQVIEDAAERAITHWLNAHTDELIEAITAKLRPVELEGRPVHTYQPNGDFGAQYIAFTDPGGSDVNTRPVVGWGNAGEGWPHLTPITSTPDGPQALPFHPDRRYTYGPTADAAAANLREITQTGEDPR